MASRTVHGFWTTNGRQHRSLMPVAGWLPYLTIMIIDDGRRTDKTVDGSRGSRRGGGSAGAATARTGKASAAARTRSRTAGSPVRRGAGAAGDRTGSSRNGSKRAGQRRAVTVWTDGSALHNPRGAMGWAWEDSEGRRDAGGAAAGTNQIGELTAVFMALMAHPTGDLKIITDSMYVMNVAEKWSKSWQRRGWKLGSGEPVKNLPLVKGIRRLLDGRERPVKFQWTKGHAGDAGNEAVDDAARSYAVRCQAGTAADRMPPEGLQTLRESVVVQTGEYEKHAARTLKHVPGASPRGHWKMVTDRPDGKKGSSGDRGNRGGGAGGRRRGSTR